MKKQSSKKAPAKKAPAKQSTPSTETAATTVSAVSETTTHYPPTGAELLERAEKTLQEDEPKLDATDLGEMMKGLEGLAEKAVNDKKFTEERVSQEKALRDRFKEVTRSFFASRIDRGTVLMEYQRLYTPIGMLSDFLKVVKVDRRTAYRWIGLAKAEREAKAEQDGTAKKASGKQSPLQSRIDSSLIPTVKDIVSYAKKAIKRLDEDDQKDVLRAVMAELTNYRKTVGVIGEPAKIVLVKDAA